MAGFRAIRADNGTYFYSSPTFTDETEAEVMEAFDRATIACYDESAPQVEGLYTQMVINPRNVSREEQAAECLIHLGLVAEDYTAENALADEAASMGDRYNGPPWDPNKVTGLGKDDPDVAGCYVHPWDYLYFSTPTP